MVRTGSPPEAEPRLKLISYEPIGERINSVSVLLPISVLAIGPFSGKLISPSGAIVTVVPAGVKV